jgi:hypothetical protein
MKTDQLWRQLEIEGAGQSGWSTRLARPEPGARLMVAIDSNGSRALLLPVGASAIPPRRTWPNCRGLEIAKMSMGGSTHLAVRLRDDGFKDVFSALAELLASRVAVAHSDSEAVGELLGALRRWQAFLAAGRDGLSVEAQRGLFGELYVLGYLLAPALGADAAVEGWKGFAGTNQDFQFGSGAIEVKTTAAIVPDSVRIASERQLDEAGSGRLFLHLIFVDEREVATGDDRGSGQTLLGLVQTCRRIFADNPLASVLLEEGLFQVGWLDLPAGRYDSRQFAIRGQRTFHVRDGFPRLVEKMLPSGVGEVSYSLNLAACQSFQVTSDSMLEFLRTSVPT